MSLIGKISSRIYIGGIVANTLYEVRKESINTISRKKHYYGYTSYGKGWCFHEPDFQDYIGSTFVGLVVGLTVGAVWPLGIFGYAFSKTKTKFDD